MIMIAWKEDFMITKTEQEVVVIIEPTVESKRSARRQQSDINVSRQERAGSAIVGALLIWLGIKRRSLGGILFAAAGAALVNRGVTGRCQLYKKLDMNTAARPKSRSENEIRG